MRRKIPGLVLVRARVRFFRLRAQPEVCSRLGADPYGPRDVRPRLETKGLVPRKVSLTDERKARVGESQEPEALDLRRQRKYAVLGDGRVGRPIAVTRGHIARIEIKTLTGSDKVYEAVASRRAVGIQHRAPDRIGLGKTECKLAEGALLCEESGVRREIARGFDTDD